MKLSNKILNRAGFALAVTILAGFGVLYLGPVSWAAGGGTTTICGAKATRNLDGGGDKIGVGEKVKSGSKPLFLSFDSSAASGTVNFSSSSVEVDLLMAPRPACTFDKFLVNLDADCGMSATHPVQAKFNCSDAGQDLYNLDVGADAELVTPPNQTQDLYDAMRQVLGLSDPSFNLGACDGADTEAEQLACASAICNMIKDQLMNGNTKALSTAADMGALVGSLQTTLNRCVASSSLVAFQGPGAACSPDDVAATGALDLLLAAPEEHVQVDSDGAGTYLLSILAGSTILSPGDNMSINMNTCAAAMNIQ